MKKSVALSELEVGQHSSVETLCEECSPAIKKKLLAVGFVKGSIVKVIRKTPLGSPIEIELMGTRFCLRKSEANCIFVQPPPNKE